ncbi:hypothetical protein GY45DRAFT_1374554 [Cubamyces sp. BRFM 1775]|nr:hypothetical protein GY45DRAFT_1374554 [Cubamyces sp. BRFM 1775]
MGDIFITNVAFANAEEERAHFDNMHGRLQALARIHERLGNLMETLRVTHVSVGVKVDEMTEYINRLSPLKPIPKQTNRVEPPHTSKSDPSALKSFKAKLRIIGKPLTR